MVAGSSFKAHSTPLPIPIGIPPAAAVEITTLATSHSASTVFVSISRPSTHSLF
ncbi:MAG: hypothetical protein MRJ93_04920 [Nitrososphaeraceae archaeon]|nr:hypothetical protein [Nitrososphaeraceae archaeon]